MSTPRSTDLEHLSANRGGLPQPRRAAAKQQLAAVIKDLARDVTASLTEVITLGRTLKRRAEHMLAYFNRAGTSNGPSEANNGRHEHLRGTAFGFPQSRLLRPPVAARHRRIQARATPPNAMSPLKLALRPRAQAIARPA